MDVLSVLLILLIVLVLPFILIWSLRKRENTRPVRNPLARGPRYRDGAITYNQYRGMRTNIEIDIPDGHSARYQRRHSPKQLKRTKPWERK